METGSFFNQKDLKVSNNGSVLDVSILCYLSKHDDYDTINLNVIRDLFADMLTVKVTSFQLVEVEFEPVGSHFTSISPLLVLSYHQHKLPQTY